MILDGIEQSENDKIESSHRKFIEFYVKETEIASHFLKRIAKNYGNKSQKSGIKNDVKQYNRRKE